MKGCLLGSGGHSSGKRGADSRSPRITVFTSPTCHWCRVAKRYLTERGLEFREVDVMSDKRGARQMTLMTGQNGVPVILVGEHAMVGWDPKEFEALRQDKVRRR